jgi:hypothetical protein
VILPTAEYPIRRRFFPICLKRIGQKNIRLL